MQTIAMKDFFYSADSGDEEETEEEKESETSGDEAKQTAKQFKKTLEGRPMTFIC